MWGLPTFFSPGSTGEKTDVVNFYLFFRWGKSSHSKIKGSKFMPRNSEQKSNSFSRPSTGVIVKPPKAPPPFIVRIVVAFRNWLFRLTDSLVPAQVAMIERIGSYYLLHALKAAVHLQISDHLIGGPKNKRELALVTGAQEEALSRLMRALVSYGVFEFKNGKFYQNRLSSVLRDSFPGSLRELTLFVSSPYHLHAWDNFVENVLSGKNAFLSTHGTGMFDYLNKNPKDASHFAGAMVSLTEMDAPTLAASYNFGKLGNGSKICDVAGGRGTLLATILAQHKNILGVLFDEDSVIKTASEFLRTYGIESRVKLISGSFFQSVPSGCSAYILKDILHDWDDDHATAILKTVRAAMEKGGVLLVAEMVVDEPSERYFGTLLDLEMLAIMDNGSQRSLRQFQELFNKSGFKFSKLVLTASPTSFVEAIAV